MRITFDDSEPYLVFKLLAYTDLPENVDFGLSSSVLVDATYHKTIQYNY